MRPLNKRNEKLKSSMIREMTILSNQYDAINLAQGFPEFAPPSSLTDRLKELADQPVHQYTPNWGIDSLREEVAKKEGKKQKRSIDPYNEVIITLGSTEAMISSMMALLERGDKVGIFSPYYNSYEANTIITETEAVFIELDPSDFSLDAERLEQALKSGVKVLILCNPNNPCGKVFTLEELRQIAGLVEKYDAYVITDEVYEHIVFEPFCHLGFAGLPGMFERTITCSSFSKTYSITGWRLGYVCGPLRLIQEVRKYHDFFTVCAPGPLQEAALTALRYNDDYYEELRKLYTQKKEAFVQGLDRAGIRHNDPQGTYFVLADISEFGYDSDFAFAKYLVKEYGVAGVPGSCFFENPNSGYIRFHFAKEDDTMREVIERLTRLKQSR